MIRLHLFAFLSALLIAATVSAQTQTPAGREMNDLLGRLADARSQGDFESAHHSFPTLLSRLNLSTAEKSEICAAFEQLDGDQLFMVETHIHHPLHQSALAGCAPSLTAKLEKMRSFREIDSSARNIRIPRLRFRTVEAPLTPDILRYMDLGEREIVLTFDDGPSPRTTPAILDLLDQAGVKAVFFNTGYNASAYASITKEVLRRGHGLGSHSYFHTYDMGCKVRRGRVTQNYALNEVAKGHSAVLAAGGGIDPYFRWPNGSATKTMKTNVKEMNLHVWDWAVDSEDWNNSKNSSSKSRAELIMDKFRHSMRHPMVDPSRWDRGIVLFHDIWQQTVETMPLLFDWLDKNGFTVVLPVSPERAELDKGLNIPTYFAPVIDLIRKDFRGILNLFGILPQLTLDPEAPAEVRSSLWSDPGDTCRTLVQKFKIDAGNIRADSQGLKVLTAAGGQAVDVTLTTVKGLNHVYRAKPGFALEIQKSNRHGAALAQCEALARRNGKVSVNVSFDLALDDQALFVQGPQKISVPAERISRISCQ